MKLFRLIWDTCISAFSGRQALYEYYFFGDPVRMASAYVASYDREPYKAAVQAFLDRKLNGAAMSPYRDTGTTIAAS